MKRVIGALCALAAMPFLAVEASAHGCHREPQRGVYGWHRHVGPDCYRVAMPEPRYSRDDYDDRRRGYGGRHEGRRDRDRHDECERRCRYIGPFKRCKTVCN